MTPSGIDGVAHLLAVGANNEAIRLLEEIEMPRAANYGLDDFRLLVSLRLAADERFVSKIPRRPRLPYEVHRNSGIFAFSKGAWFAVARSYSLAMQSLDRENPAQVAHIKNNLGNLARAEGSYEIAECEYMLAQSIALRAGELALYCKVSANRIVLQAERGDLQGAVETLGETRAELWSRGSTFEQMDIFTQVRLGIADLDIMYCAQLVDEVTFRRRASQCISIAESDGFLRGKAMALHILGCQHLELDELFSAIDCFEQELEIAISMNLPRHIGNAMLGLADAGRQGTDPRKAMELIDRARPCVNKYATAVKRFELQALTAECDLRMGRCTEGWRRIESIQKFMVMNRFSKNAILKKRIADIAKRYF